MKFTPGQHVISNGTLYIYRHDCTASGAKPKMQVSPKDGHLTPRPCGHALVNLPGGSQPIVLHRASLQPVADTVSAAPAPKADVQTSSKRPAQLHPRAKADDAPTPPTPTITVTYPVPTTPKVDVLASLKADALDSQAERLEGYAKTLRDEAAALRHGEG